MREIIIRSKQAQHDGKRTYKTMKYARKAARSAQTRHGGTWEAYFCPWCVHPITNKQGIHIGHRVCKGGRNGAG